MKISFCGKCGAELGVGTNFCANCGWKLPDEEERNIIESLNELKHNNEESSAVTPSASLTPQYIEEPSDVKKCINCETSLPHSAKFCKQCGGKQVEAVSTPEKWCIYCGNVMDPDDIFCSNCGANQNGDVEQQYFAQAVPVLDTPKKKSYGGLIAVLVSVLFIASIVGGVLIFGTGNVKAEEMNGIWSVGFTVTGMNDDMNYYDYSAYIGQTTESTLTVDLDEDGKGTARLVTTVGGIDYDYEVMNAQYNRGKLVCIADTASQNIEFTGNVRKKGDRYQLNGKFKMIFIEGEKITTSGKWTATKEIGQTADTAPGNSSKPNNTEDLPNLAVYATMLDIIGEWEGTATLILSLAMKKTGLFSWIMVLPRTLLNSLTT